MSVFKMPVQNHKLTSKYDPNRLHPKLRVIRKHAGVDLINTKVAKAPILAAAKGRVRLVKTTTDGYGKYVIITHNVGGKTYETVYAHLDSFSVKVGQSVEQGEQIGIMGNTGIGTGVHLHFEIHRGEYRYENGTYPTSFDPWSWINPNAFKMTVSENGLKLVKKYEGFRKDAYKDMVGVPTIGYGLTKYPNGNKVLMTDVITEEEASVLLEQQVNEHAQGMFKYIKVELNQNQFDALASFHYNLGENILAKDPALVRYINSKQWSEVARVMNMYNKAGGKVAPGLVKRRNEEAELLLTPVTSNTAKGDDVLDFSVGATKDMIADFISQSVGAKYIDKSWEVKFKEGKMTTGDLIALQMIVNNKKALKK